MSLKERDRRYERIRESMRNGKIDCLLVAGRDGYTSRGNLRYVSNYGVNFGEQYCLVPSEVEPVFLGSILALSRVRSAGWIHDCLEMVDAPKQIVQELSRFDRGNKMGIVGLPSLSVPVYLAVEAAFHGRVVDATSVFRQLRLIKSPEEIERMRTSASIADKAYAVIRDMLRPGLRDYDIYGEVKRVVHGMGSEYSMEFIDTETARINFFNPVGRVLDADGTLALEITPAYEGYYAQLTVTVPVTEYPRHIQPVLSVWREALEIGEGLLKPGTIVRDLYRNMTGVVRERGYLSHLRAGHGIGLDAIDFISISETETTELEAGMTLAFHPCVAIEAGGDGIGMGYTYLITEKGAEKLSQLNL